LRRVAGLLSSKEVGDKKRTFLAYRHERCTDQLLPALTEVDGFSKEVPVEVFRSDDEVGGALAALLGPGRVM
jgi:hypothetical protein